VPHQIRTSERRSFRACRRRWNWAYIQGYVPLEEPKPLEFGRAFHVAMETIYDPETWDLTTADDKRRLAKAAFVRECEIQRKSYLEETGETRLDFELKDDYDQRIVLGCGMIDYYIDYVHKVHDEWFRPVKVEVEFEVPITDEKGEAVLCNNSPRCGQIHSNPDVVVHGGRIDAIVEDLIFGGYWIFDWKTAASLRATFDILETDDQICTYCWAARDKLNIDIRGFVYAEIRKDYPRPPKELKRPRNGCKFSTDKTMATTGAVYREHVIEHDRDAFEAGCYDEFLYWLENDKDAAKFHQWIKIKKTPTQLRNIGVNVSLEAQDMVDQNLRMYPSAGRFSCPTCAYRVPCGARFNDEDYLYTLDTLFRKVK
jgi:hypothetical protein